VLERAVTFNDGAKKSTGRIDLYKRGCFVLETKQGTDSANAQQMQALRDMLQQAAQPLTSGQVAARFNASRPRRCSRC
jgi:hypothetical protein